jgi:predicted permease
VAAAALVLCVMLGLMLWLACRRWHPPRRKRTGIPRITS